MSNYFIKIIHDFLENKRKEITNKWNEESIYIYKENKHQLVQLHTF